MTIELLPVLPKSTKYSDAFEATWKAHPHGVKKAAFKAGAAFSESEWLGLQHYLEKRHTADLKWLEGTYVPHLSTFINQERWTDEYEKKWTVKRREDKYDRANAEQEGIRVHGAPAPATWNKK